MRRASLLLVVISLLLSARAASAAQYQIEMLVFLRDANPASEYVPHGIAPPSRTQAIATLAPSGGSPTSLGTKGITVLPSSQLRLKAEADALRRQGLRPLLHTAWRQPVGGRNNRDWLWIDAGPVKGLVRVSVGRYLHFNTYLTLNGRVEKAHRRMRSSEFHYLDSPGYGLLVRITPLGG